MNDKRKPETAENTGQHNRSASESSGMETVAPGTPSGPLALSQRWTAARKREVKVSPKSPDVSQELGAVAEAQRSLAADISQLRDQLNAVQRGVGEGHDEVRQNRDQVQAAFEQIKGMREEVRGLYVESSGLKGDIAQLGKQVEGLEGSLGSFRLSAGIVVAVVLLLQLLLAGLMLRGRG